MACVIYKTFLLCSIFYQINALGFLNPGNKGKCLTVPNTAKKVDKSIKECQEEVKSNLIKEAFNIILEHGHHDHHEHVVHDLHHDHYDIHHEPHHDQHNEPHINYHELPSHHVDIHPYTEHPLYPPHHDQHVVDHSTHAEHHNKHMEYIYNAHKHNSQNGPENHIKHLEFHDEKHFPEPINHGDHQDHKHFGHYIDFDPNHKRKIDKSDEYAHPTTVSYEDRRIAGCLLHCVYAKNHAVDKLGWPTLDGLVNFYSEGANEHGFFMATLRAADHCLKGSSSKYHVNRHVKPEKGQSCDLSFDVFDCISDRITEYCSDHHQKNHHN